MSLLQNKSDYCPHQCTAQVDHIIIQPFPAAHLDCLRAAGMQGMFLGLFVAMRATVDGLDGRAQERIEQRAEQAAQDGNASNHPKSPARAHQPGQDGDQRRAAGGRQGAV